MQTVRVSNLQTYVILLPDGHKMIFWFDGNQLGNLLKAYNIPFKRVNSIQEAQKVKFEHQKTQRITFKQLGKRGKKKHESRRKKTKGNQI